MISDKSEITKVKQRECHHYEVKLKKQDYVTDSNENAQTTDDIMKYDDQIKIYGG